MIQIEEARHQSMRLTIQRLLVHQIKSILSELNLSTRGLKEELVRRLLAYLCEFIDNERFTEYETALTRIDRALASNRVAFGTFRLSTLSLVYTAPFDLMDESPPLPAGLEHFDFRYQAELSGIARQKVQCHTTSFVFDYDLGKAVRGLGLASLPANFRVLLVSVRMGETRRQAYPPGCVINVDDTRFFVREPQASQDVSRYRRTTLLPGQANRVVVTFSSDRYGANDTVGAGSTFYAMQLVLAAGKSAADYLPEIRAKRRVPREMTLALLRRPADADLEASTWSVALACPFSCARIRVPGRGEACRHVQCFDLLPVLDRLLGSQGPLPCPICNLPMQVGTLVLDTFFEELVQAVPADADAVLIDESGAWTLPTKPSVPSDKFLDLTEVDEGTDATADSSFAEPIKIKQEGEQLSHVGAGACAGAGAGAAGGAGTPRPSTPPLPSPPVIVIDSEDERPMVSPRTGGLYGHVDSDDEHSQEDEVDDWRTGMDDDDDDDDDDEDHLDGMAMMHELFRGDRYGLPDYDDPYVRMIASLNRARQAQRVAPRGRSAPRWQRVSASRQRLGLPRVVAAARQAATTQTASRPGVTRVASGAPAAVPPGARSSLGATSSGSSFESAIIID